MSSTFFLNQTFILLVLFFASLISIIAMIGRKLVTLKHEEIPNHHEEVLFELPYLKEVKHITIASVRKSGYALLVGTVRFYVRSTDLLKNKYREIRNKIKNMIAKSHATGEKKEISKFLKIIGDYKQKIREITHKIKKEENL